MSQQDILQKSILKVLRPLIRILLRNNIAFGAFSELARQAYVEVATEDFKVDGRKQSNSRISTITGLSRKEVKRLQELDEDANANLTEKYNRAARVVFGWVHDDSYQDQYNESLPLDFDAEGVSFTSLVKTYSGDVPPRAILDELSRVGVVELGEDEKLHLLSRAYIPKAGISEKVEYLGSDISALINTMDRNIYETDKTPFFQRKVYYDNLPDDCIEDLKKIIAKNSQELLERVDVAMAIHDRDSNPNVAGTGRRAIGVGVYYFENKDVKEQEDE